MTVRAFLDTNVVVYLFDSDEPDKQATARSLLASPDYQFVVSTQVLGEFYVTVTRKLARPLDAATAAAAVDRLGELFVVGTDAALVRSAIRTTREAQLSYWDALVVEAAASLPCEVLLSEDMAHGAVLRGVRVVNPFRGD